MAYPLPPNTPAADIKTIKLRRSRVFQERETELARRHQDDGYGGGKYEHARSRSLRSAVQSIVDSAGMWPLPTFMCSPYERDEDSQLTRTVLLVDEFAALQAALDLTSRVSMREGTCCRRRLWSGTSAVITWDCAYLSDHLMGF